MESFLLYNQCMIWKQITNAPLYEVSNTGLVRHIKYKRIRKPRVGRGGYHTYHLPDMDGVVKNMRAARIVASAFICDIPAGYVVDHIDRDRKNDSVRNLRVVTIKENNGNRVMLSVGVVDSIIELHAAGVSSADIVDRITR